MLNSFQHVCSLLAGLGVAAGVLIMFVGGTTGLVAGAVLFSGGTISLTLLSLTGLALRQRNSGDPARPVDSN